MKKLLNLILAMCILAVGFIVTVAADVGDSVTAENVPKIQIAKTEKTSNKIIESFADKQGIYKGDQLFENPALQAQNNIVCRSAVKTGFREKKTSNRIRSPSGFNTRV
jgi:hypothetical protein